MKYYFRAFQKYFVASGRASRRELWVFLFFHNLVLVVLSLLDFYLDLYPTLYAFSSLQNKTQFGVTTILYICISAIPAMCLHIRRLHDVGKSDYWFWLGNVPLMSLYLLYLYLKRGDADENDYGPPVCHDEESYEYSPTPDPVITQPTIAASSRVKFCRHCGENLLDGSKFCRKCGTKVVEVPQQRRII